MVNIIGRGIKYLTRSVLIIASTYVLISYSYKTCNIKSLKFIKMFNFMNYKSYSNHFASAIVTLGVLSLSFLSLVVAFSDKIYGIRYRSITSYNKYPFKYKTLLINNGLILSLSFFVYMFNNSFFLLLMLIVILANNIYFSYMYYFNLFNHKVIKEVIINEKTLKKHSDEIIEGVYSDFINEIDDKKNMESSDHLKLINKIKEVIKEVVEDEDKIKYIEQYEIKLFHQISKILGFDKSIEYHKESISSYDINPELYKVINIMVDKEKTLDVKYNFPLQAHKVLKMKEIDHNVIRFFYYCLLEALLKENRENEFIRIFRTITDDFNYDLYFEEEKSLKKIRSIDVAIGLFDLYKNKLVFNNNDKEVILMLKALNYTLGDSFYSGKYVKNKLIALMFLSNFVYIKLDKRFTNEFMKQTRDKMNYEVGHDFTKGKTSLNKIIEKHLNSIEEYIKEIDYKSLNNIRINYFPKHASSSSTYAYLKELVIDINTYLLITTIRHVDNKIDLFKFEGMTKKELENSLINFYTMFDDDETKYNEAKLNNFKTFLDYVGIEDLPKIDNHLKGLIKFSKDEATKIRSELRDKEVEPKLKQKEIKFNNKNFLGGITNLKGEKELLIEDSIGIIDSKYYKDDYIKMITRDLEREIVARVYNKHLKLLEGNFNDDEEILKVIKYLNEHNINATTHNRFKYVAYIRNNKNEEVIDFVDNLKIINKTNIWNEPVIINEDKFKFQIENIKITPTNLSDIDIKKYIEDNIRISDNVYKIERHFYSYTEAYERIKKDYIKLNFKVYYKYEISEDSGVILKLTKGE